MSISGSAGSTRTVARGRRGREIRPFLRLMPIPTVHTPTVRFGGILALDSVSFDGDEGAIVGLIGPNGAGKTTLFNCLSRLDTPDGGDVRFDGRPILGLSAHRIAGLGIGRTFHSRPLCPTLPG